MFLLKNEQKKSLHKNAYFLFFWCKVCYKMENNINFKLQQNYPTFLEAVWLYLKYELQNMCGRGKVCGRKRKLQRKQFFFVSIDCSNFSLPPVPLRHTSEIVFIIFLFFSSSYSSLSVFDKMGVFSLFFFDLCSTHKTHTHTHTQTADTLMNFCFEV